MQIGLRMALLIIVVSVCITGTALLAGSRRYTKMQVEANKEIGYELGRMTAILTYQEDIMRYINEVRHIYETAPAELRDMPGDEDPEGGYFYSTDHGPYKELFAPIRTKDYEESQELLEKAAKDINALGISIVFPDFERGRTVYVICGVPDEKYSEYYSPPGYWMEEYDFVLEYEKNPVKDARGIHVGSESINGDYLMTSIVPFYDPDTGEVLAFVNVERPWTNLEGERNRFLAGFMMIVGIVTLILVLLSEAVLTFAIMRPLNKLTFEQSRMATELDVASNIQLSMLPDLHGAGAGAAPYTVYGRLIPAKEVGGDFYDFFVIDADHIAIVIADVVGKGVPASLFSMVAKTMLKMSALEGHSPGRVCTEVNNRLCENNAEAMFVTVWFGIYTISERKLTYVNAGHDSAVIYAAHDIDARKRWKYDAADSDMALGIMPDLPYTEHIMILSKGDRIFLYTDGVVEAQAAEDGADLYGEERLLSILSAAPGEAGDVLIAAVYDDTCKFIGDSPQFDDITMVLLDVND